MFLSEYHCRADADVSGNFNEDGVAMLPLAMMLGMLAMSTDSWRFYS